MQDTSAVQQLHYVAILIYIASSATTTDQN